MSANAFQVSHAREIAAAREQGRREGFNLAMENEVPRAVEEARSDGLYVLLTGIAMGVGAAGLLHWIFF